MVFSIVAHIHRYETAMRKIALGLAIGYILVAPGILWTIGDVPNYGAGLTMVLDRSGVLVPAKDTALQISQYRNRKARQVKEYLTAKIDDMLRLPGLAPGPD